MTGELTKAAAVTRAAELRGLAKRLGRAARSQATRDAYGKDFERFTAWCRQDELQALPAAPETVGLYIAHLYAKRPALSTGTIERAIAGIAYQHRLAGHQLDRGHPAISHVLAGAKRERKSRPKGKRPIIGDELRRVLEVCRDDFAGKRNRAMLLVGFFGALRGSELVGIEVGHLTESPAGYRLLIPSSKGDQEGEGQYIGLPRQKEPNLCPVRAVKAWLQTADIETGPVFVRLNSRGQPEIFGKPMTDRSWRRIVKELAHRAGFSAQEVAEISGHSLRAGHITTGYLKNVDEERLQRQARQKDPRTTRRYNRQATVFVANSADGLMD